MRQEAATEKYSLLVLRSKNVRLALESAEHVFWRQRKPQPAAISNMKLLNSANPSKAWAWSSTGRLLKQL